MRKIVVFLVFGLTLVAAPTVFAYLIHTYELEQGVYNGRYYVLDNQVVTENNVTVNYTTLVNEVVTTWNNAVDPEGPWPWQEQTNVSFTRGYNIPTSANIRFDILSAGSVNLNGWVDFFDSSGNQLNAVQATFPNSNWHQGRAHLNTYQIHRSDFKSNTARIKGTITHEMGHAMGLLHTQDSNESVSVMYKQNTTNRPTTPQADDVSGIRAQY